MLDNEKEVTFWNRGAELITGFKSEDVTGKNCYDNILVPVNSFGTKLCSELCPAKKTLEKQKQVVCNAYIQHKEGFRLPVSLKFIPIQIKENTSGVAVIISDSSPKILLPQRTKELEHLSLLDKLTGTANKQYLEIHISSRINELRLYRLPFGLLYIDIDKLTDINQVYGYEAGNRILRTVGQTLINNTRFFDIVGRWEEDDFIVTILNITQEKLDVVANKLRLLVSQSSVLYKETVIFSKISIGATLAAPKDTLGSLIKRGEALKNHSKKLGGNRVSLTFD